MATAASVGSSFKKIGVHLECSICTDKCKTPKVLDCLHSFCEECLVKYRDGSYRGAPKIPCPECRQETTLPQSGVHGLKTNFHLVGLIEEFKLQEKVACSAEAKLLCQVCDKGKKARDHCVDCKKYICKDCCKTHQQFPTLRTHKIASFYDIRQGKVKVTKQPDEYKCHKHNEGVKFYCKKCDKLICQGCTVIDHPITKHVITDTGTASREYRQSLQAELPALGRDIKGLELSSKDITEAKKVVINNTAKARKGVQDRAAEVIATVKAEEKRLLSEITTQERKQNKRQDEHEKTLSNMLQIKKHSLQTTQDVASNASDCDLISLYPVISKDVAKLKAQPTPKAAGLKSHPVFVQNQKLGIDLGKVMVGDTWEMCHSFGRQGSGEGEFETARGIAAAAEPDEIAVTDFNNKRVKICNNQGQTKRTIPIAANDVVAVSNQWVCAHRSKMMVYHRDTKPARDFSTLQESEVGKTDVVLASVAVMPNGNIIVGDLKRKVLTELDLKNGKTLHTMTVKVQPHFLAVLSNGWIAISGGVDGLVEIVEVSNGNAVTIATIQPTIGGKPVKYCMGICSNSSGIYIAVSASELEISGHIHHFDCEGQFVSCVAQGLYDPQGITFTADGQQLAVVDVQAVKIYHKV